jgi:hypothetical protein
MELNHQIRFCRPFPFLFGFRAILNNYMVTYRLTDIAEVITQLFKTVTVANFKLRFFAFFFIKSLPRKNL